MYSSGRLANWTVTRPRAHFEFSLATLTAWLVFAVTLAGVMPVAATAGMDAGVRSLTASRTDFKLWTLVAVVAAVVVVVVVFCVAVVADDVEEGGPILRFQLLFRGGRPMLRNRQTSQVNTGQRRGVAQRGHCAVVLRSSQILLLTYAVSVSFPACYHHQTDRSRLE